MSHAKTARFLVGVTAVLILVGPSLAQLIEVVKFKGIEIPHTLKFGDEILGKGLYDLAALENPTTASYYLRFSKKDKIICLIKGLRLDYKDLETAPTKIQDIPQKPRLKMKRNTEDKVFIFMIETGILSKTPGRLLKFELEYVE